MKYSYDTARPYMASYVIVRKNGKIAFLLRANTDWKNNFYCLPSGKVEKDETYKQAAIREAKEEIGIKLNPKNLKHALTMERRETPDLTMMWVDVLFEVSEWGGEPINAEPNIHSELAWLDPKRLPNNTIPSVKFAIEKIEAGYNYAEYGWEDNNG